MADITGTNSNDTLQGGEGSDTIIGADGDDSITGSGGNDTIQGDSSTVTPPTTASDQQTMNESDSNSHESGPVVEALSDGNFFLAWYEGADGSSTGGPVKGKIVDAEGNDLSGVFDISDPSLFGVRTEDLNDMPPLDATLLDDGSVVVTYQSGFSGNGSGSHDDEGTALKGIVVDPSDPVAPSVGTEFLVNAADSNAFESGGVVEALPDGGFFVAWYENAETNATDNSGTQILGQYFDADGNKVGAQVQVGDHTSSVGVQISEYVDMPPLDVTVLENGDVAVTYNAGFNNSHSYTGDDHGSAVVGSIIDSSTQTAGAEFLINDGNTNTDEGPAIIEALPDGGFVAMWYEQSGTNDNNGYPHARIFDDDGNPVTAPLNIGTHDGDGYVSGLDQHESSGHNMPVMDMVVMADGNIAVTWLAGEGSGGQSVDAGGTTVMGAIIDASTGIVGDEFIINDPNSGASEEPARIEALPNGGFVAVWAEGGGGDQHDGYLQVQYFDAAGNKLGDAIEIGTPGSAQDARVASDGEYDQPPVDFAVQDDGSIFIGFQGADHITNADYDDRGSALIGATIAPPTIVEDGAGNDTIAGGDGDDLIFGGAGSDSISGGSGDDYIDGGDGDDYLTTGLGQDTLIGGEGDDTLKNSAGDDSLVGGAGNDSIVATAGNDTLEGGDGADTLDGGSENDSISGGAGDDVIYTGLGDDEASGGDDADVFHVHGAEGIEFNQTGTDGLALVSDMSDFPTDELSFEMQFSSTGAASSSQVFASYAVPGEDNEFQLYELTTSELYVTIAGQGVNTGVSTSGLYDGSPHSLAVTWESSTGDLKLYLDGAEVYSGTVATGDTLTQGGVFTLGQEQDVVGGGFELDDRFQGEIHNAKLFNDVRTPSEIASDAGDHEADTSDANLIAGWVPDAETGGFSDLTGNHDMTMSGDAEIVTTLGGDDTITGGEGGNDIDTIDLSAVTVPVTVTYTGDEAGTITDGTNTITFSEIEKLILTDQADVVDASDDSVGVDIDGAGGNDLITGGLGKDTLDGGDGDDTLIAGFDDGTGDVFIGGSGTDTYQIDGSPVENWAFNVDLGSGSDQYGNTYSGIENIIGGDRDDTLTGDGEDNVFDGRAGADSLSGGTAAIRSLAGLAVISYRATPGTTALMAAKVRIFCKAGLATIRSACMDPAIASTEMTDTTLSTAPEPRMRSMSTRSRGSRRSARVRAGKAGIGTPVPCGSKAAAAPILSVPEAMPIPSMLGMATI